MTENFKNNLKKLDAISELKHNWDLHGTPKFNKELIAFCKEQLCILEETLNNIENVQPEIFPTNNETIQFEFENGSDWLEIEIPNDMSHISCYISKNDEVIEQSSDMGQLLKIVEAFYG